MRRVGLFLLLLGSGTAACSGNGTDGGAATEAEAGAGKPGGSQGGAHDEDPSARDAGADDSGTNTKPAVPGVPYVKREFFSGTYFYDPISDTSIELARVDDRRIRRASQGGALFAYSTDSFQSTKPAELYEGFFGVGGAATKTATLTSKSASSPPIEVSVGNDGRVYYTGEITQRGQAMLYRAGQPISIGDGRGDGRGHLRFLDAVGDTVVWLQSVGDDKLFVRWPGAAPEAELEANKYVVSTARDAIGISPTGRCVWFPAPIQSDGGPGSELGVRCAGGTTSYVRTPSQIPLSPIGSRPAWHPAKDRFVVIDRSDRDVRPLVFADRGPSGWTTSTLALPADFPRALLVMASDDGRYLYVVADGGLAGHRIFVADFDGAAPPQQLTPAQTGAQAELRVAGVGKDGRLAVVRYPDPASTPRKYELLVVSPDGKVASVLSTETTIERVRWSPDGKYIAVRTHAVGIPPLRSESGDVHVVDLGTGRTALFTPQGSIAKAMAWSGASDFLAIVAEATKDEGALYVAPSTSTGPATKRVDDRVSAFLVDPPVSPF